MSGRTLLELDELRHQPADDARSRRAWELVAAVYGRPDRGAVVDFAVEHGLVRPLEEDHGHKRRPEPVAWVNPTDGSEMIGVPAGPFVVGPDNRPATCAAFSLARFPVTNARFRRFLDASGYEPPADHPDPDAFLAHWTEAGIPHGTWHQPAVWVSYIDALAYCAWAGLTLPTEWLWEKATRGPDGRPYPWGDIQPTKSLCQILAEGPCTVGQFPRVRSPYGCEDLIGNVSEWCRSGGDDPGEVPDAPPVVPVWDAQAPAYAIVRGSCFFRRDPRRMAAHHRRRLAVIRRNRWTGFRPACLLACRPA